MQDPSTSPLPRRWLAWVVLLVTMASIDPASQAGSPLARPVKIARPPNILILVGDDHAGGTLGIDGDPRLATPRLDALAGQGVRFDRAFCNAPVCSASRQSFLTGRLPHAVGVTRLPTPLPETAVTLGDWLGGLGYDTAAIGKMHFNGPSKHGFATRIDSPDWQAWLRPRLTSQNNHRRPWRPLLDPAASWLNAETRSFGLPESLMESSYLVDRATEFLDRHRDRSGSKPFALVIGFPEPHSPFRFPDDWPKRYRPDQFPAPTLTGADRLDQPRVFATLTAAQVQGIQASYYTSLEFLDHQVGRVLDALGASGLAGETIVVYLGDNGYMLGRHGRFEKHCSYESAVRVPLILRWPGHLPEGRRVTELTELVDVLPTLLELSDLPRPADLHGQSLKPLALGEPGAKGRDVVVSEYLENEEAMVRSPRYKLVVGTGARRRQDGYESANPMTRPSERLYDLEADPEESHDIRDLPDMAQVGQELRRKLLARLATTRGSTPPVPPGLSEVDALRWCLVPRD